MLIELDDRRRWQDWEAKDLRPLCQRAKESAQAQGVEDEKFQRKVNALFDGMYSRAKDPVKHQVEQIQVNGVQGHLNDRTPPHEKLRTR